MIIDGVILAGGQSSRMGQDKALLTRDHRDMFFYTLDSLQELPLNQIFISRNPSQISYLTRLQVVPDQYQNLGPLSGIYSVAQHTHADAILVVPIDLPLLEPRDLKKIMSMASDPSHDGEQPIYFEDNYLPILLPLTDNVRDYLSDVVSGRIKTRSVKALCRQFNGIAISPDDIDRLQNTNTPEQWLAAKLELMEI
jgi:molybdopterin-guanine dinucleotide biosynthesis protein A